VADSEGTVRIGRPSGAWRQCARNWRQRWAGYETSKAVQRPVHV